MFARIRREASKQQDAGLSERINDWEGLEAALAYDLPMPIVNQLCALTRTNPSTTIEDLEQIPLRDFLIRIKIFLPARVEDLGELDHFIGMLDSFLRLDLNGLLAKDFFPLKRKFKDGADMPVTRGVQYSREQELYIAKTAASVQQLLATFSDRENLLALIRQYGLDTVPIEVLNSFAQKARQTSPFKVVLGRLRYGLEVSKELHPRYDGKPIGNAQPYTAADLLFFLYSYGDNAASELFRRFKGYHIGAKRINILIDALISCMKHRGVPLANFIEEPEPDSDSDES